MLNVYRIIAFSLLLALCFSFDFPVTEKKQVHDSGLEKLLSSVRRLVTGLKKDIKTHEGQIVILNSMYQSLSQKVGSVQDAISSLERRVSGARVACDEKSTPWAPYSNAPIMYLDRQAVTCPTGYFLSRFHLVRQADRASAPVHYLFRCCKFIL